ncbi:zinc finger protein 236 isoform X2 [Teleopsis dalmanni]|uniref:zinc finger protein 236 isoform X2 n=1 Tax=Teleopsis dalmanni TaxID=139649 RepID=UPI0018CFEB15|nr:zinc finger protein 236 isoform X2 [Teleopsis dalmanni]
MQMTTEIQQKEQHQHYQQSQHYQLKSQPFKMDADFWQQARGPFGIHAAAAVATNQLQQHHHYQQHQHSNHPHQVQQQLQQQQPDLRHNNQLQHHSIQQQSEQSHHLLFNAAAAAAAAAHLSGVAKSNELQSNCANRDAVIINKHESNERISPEKQDPMLITSNQQQHQKFQTNLSGTSTSSTGSLQQHLQQQLQHQLQSHQHNISDSGGEKNNSLNESVKHEQIKNRQSGFNINSNELQMQQLSQQQEHSLLLPTPAPETSTLPAILTQQQHKQHQEQQQQHQQKQQQQLRPTTPPLQVSTLTHPPSQSPQQSLTPSGSSSTPDIKFNSEKLVNEIQLQLSRSNSTAAISERTLEECWSTLQRLFMHKSAMQQIQQIPRVGLGPTGPGSISGDSKPHQCQQCMKSFSSNHQLVQHIRVHTGEKPYKCSYCDRRFKQLSHVQQHTRLHTGERPYKCHLPDCGRAFIQLSNLQQHLRNHDAQVERAKNRPFHCNICGKGFATESSLRTHTSKELQLHLGVLQQHAALIGGPNATSCPVCHKLFLGTEALMEHMKHAHKDKSPSNISTSNDPFLAKRRSANHPCPICGKHYVNEGSLRKHLSSHETSQSLRMWPCSVCQAVFTQENGLLTHMEHMRMDPKHQFAAQYVLSRAAAERRERDSIFVATLAATANSGNLGTNNSSSILPLINEAGGESNSLCHSPSVNSECSSNGRISSSSTSDQENGENNINNNNNNNNNNSVTNNNNTNNINNNNKINNMVSSSHSHLSTQYSTDNEMQVTNRMSLMAAASAAASAINVDTSVNPSTGSAAVQAAVVNLAAAMRINQQNTVANSSNVGRDNNADHNLESNLVNTLNNSSIQHQQQNLQPNNQDANTNLNTQNTSPVNMSTEHSTSAVSAVMAMTAMRDTMMLTNMGSSMHQHIESLTHQQHCNNLTPNHTYAPPVIPTHQPSQQSLHPHVHHTQHHNHQLSQLHHPSNSPETALRMQQQAEAILRSHTEAAFRLAATVANGVGNTATGTTNLSNSNNTNSSVKVESHQHQQQHSSGNSISDLTIQHHQAQQQSASNSQIQQQPHNHPPNLPHHTS